ncbi:MAG: GLUG motif-containing protein [Planctomycetota bacterium]|jgi:hypothetical protein
MAAKVIVTAILAAVLTASTSLARYSDGTGISEDPYQINDANDMNEIGAHPNDWDAHFVLTADIDMSGFEYTTALIAPDTNNSTFGFQGTAFTGVFDGNEHTIFNFTCQSDGINDAGLFGRMSGENPLVKNLRLVDPNFDGSGYRVGLLAGSVYGGTIQNCSVEGGYISSGTQVGGLVGQLYNGTISNCCATAEVVGGGYSGGLVGSNFGGVISQCHSSGNVSVYDITAGGLVGKNYGIISNCYSTANVNSEEAGGLVGRNGVFDTAGSINNCYATGMVSGYRAVGGLAGGNYYGAIISNCYAQGSVSGDDSVGGLVGENSGTITSCYSTGEILEEIYWTDAALNEINRANLNGGSRENLLFGLGDPHGIALDTIAGKMYWAGAGKIQRANIDGTDIEDIITSELSRPRGIALAVITNGGGLVGFDDGGSYTACFWDSDINPDVNGIGNGSDPDVIGESTANMQTQSTYTSAGWDFVGETVNGPNDIWRLCEDGIDYPKLSIQFLSGDFVCPDGVNFIDFSILASLWQTTFGEISWNPVCDISDPNDNIIDELDLAVFCDNWLEGIE